MADIGSILIACNELDEKLLEGDDSQEHIIRLYLQLLNDRVKYKVPDFPKG